MLVADGGSFRDPSGRVYLVGDGSGGRRVVRGLTPTTAETVERLLAEPFFRRLLADGDVVDTHAVCPDDPVAAAVMDRGWAAVVEHELIDFPTWPYEWPFGMLKDAALLQLRVLETCVRAGWMLKDATRTRRRAKAGPVESVRRSSRDQVPTWHSASRSSTNCGSQRTYRSSLLVTWLRSLDATVIVEFIDRDDEMFAKLVANKREDYADYTRENFQSEVDKHFAVVDRMELKGGKRTLMLLEPKNPPWGDYRAY